MASAVAIRVYTMKTISIRHVPRSSSGLRAQDLISLLATGCLSADYRPLFISPSDGLYVKTTPIGVEYVHLRRGKHVNVVVKLGSQEFYSEAFYVALTRAAKTKVSWSSSWCQLRIKLNDRTLCGVSVRSSDDREQNQGTCISQIT